MVGPFWKKQISKLLHRVQQLKTVYIALCRKEIVFKMLMVSGSKTPYIGLVPVCAKGRDEHQKLNQTTP